MTAGSIPDEDYFPARVVAFSLLVEGNPADSFELVKVEPIAPQL
jgi:hypothetical protein